MPERITLTELQLIIRDSLYIAMPGFYWVVAEISEIKVNSTGHCYLELIEKTADDEDVKARIKAIIWSSRYRFLMPFFQNSTGENLTTGMKILAKARIEYHELYGLSIIISDIDPSFTLGEMALKKQMIIRRLEEDGVFTMNKEVEFPVLPQRIAIVSSENAAGYQDFVKHLKGNRFGYVYYTALFESAMQGAETEKSIVASLNRVADHAGLFDVVVIIRGGGSQTDLSWFDNYNIAYHVTQFPLPVLTGIGHEKDLSVTDMVAHLSLKTPTAVADFLVQCTADAEEKLKETASEIAEITMTTIEDYRRQTDSFRSDLLPFSRILIAEQKERLSNSIMAMMNSGRKQISNAEFIPSRLITRLVSVAKSSAVNAEREVFRARSDLKSLSTSSIGNLKMKAETLASSLIILDPENVLKRGYTITTMDGRLVKSAGNAYVDKVLETRFHDGKVSSRVIKNSSRMKGDQNLKKKKKDNQ